MVKCETIRVSSWWSKANQFAGISCVLHSYRHAFLLQIRLHFPDFELFIVEERGGECSVGTAVSQCFVKVFLCAGTAGSDDRDGNVSSDRAGQLKVIA